MWEVISSNTIGGWKTNLGCTAAVILGIVDLLNGDIEAGLTKITGAITAYGVAHKAEKANK